ncbi:ABC transporter substrate-binding protein [Haladaptatus halobius]|uniref:ABC transporter substrate-binding protein n=1 Tax=Haladaptatus halobius TaxID=2884875 RepID=UPI001D0AB203|nr:ABC transporter substrate-binding protein [Haladaptatus halobius]
MLDSNSHETAVNRRKFLKATSAGSALAISGLAGCTSGGGGNSNSGKSGKLKEVTVGVLDPQSGPYSFLGKAEIQGAKLAAKDLEKELGITVNIKVADTETDPNTGVQRLQRLVSKEDIQLAQGGVSSSVAVKMGQWASQNGLAFIASGSHSDATTGSSCGKYMFRTPSSNTMLAQTAGSAFADYADSWYLMYADYTWGKTGRDAMKKVLKDSGAKVVGSVASPLGAGDYTQQLNEVASSNAKAAAIIFAGTDQRTIMKQFVNKGMHNNMKMGGPLLEDEVFWGVGKDVAQHAGVWATVWSPSVKQGKKSKKFMERIKKEYNSTPYSRHYLGYTSLDQMVRAANRAGKTDAEAVRKELEDHKYTKQGLLDGNQYWRICDHQNIKPTYAVKALPKEKMKDKPYRVWFEPFSKSKGDDVARSCEQTGCGF